MNTVVPAPYCDDGQVCLYVGDMREVTLTADAG